MNGTHLINRYLNQTATSLILLTLTIILITDSVYGYALALALIFAMPTLRFHYLKSLHRLDYYFIFSLILYPLITWLNIFTQDPSPWREMDIPSRFLICILLYLWIRVQGIRIEKIVISTGIGTIITGMYSLNHLISNPSIRFGGWDSPIIYGEVGFILMAISLTPINVKEQYKTIYKIFLFLIVAFGSLTCLASQTRGVIIWLPLVLVYLIWFNKLYSLTRVEIFKGLITLLITLYLLSYIGSFERFTGIGNQIKSYLSEGKITDISMLDKSSIERLDLFKLGLNLVREKPVFGYGKGQFMAAMNEYAINKDINPNVLKYEHVHNDILNVQIELGIFGTVGILILFLGALALSTKNNFTIQSRYLILVVVLSWVLFGLTGTQLSHHKITVIQLVLLCIGYAHGMNNKYIRLHDR